MARAKKVLTPREDVFVKAYAGIGHPVHAAQVAGYAHPNPDGYKILSKPLVAESVRKIQERRILNDLMPKALNLLERAIGDETWKPEVRIKAAAEVRQWVQQVTGVSGADKAPEDMTPDELAARIAMLRARQVQLADGAKVIDAEPIEDGPDEDVFG